MRSTRPLSLDDQVTISMASMPERSAGMLTVVKQLIDACDNFELCLNGYPADFDDPILHDPKVCVYRTQPVVGARGKFLTSYKLAGYHLTVDDDIDYPDNYVAALVAAVAVYERRAVVGYHGCLYGSPDARFLVTFEEAWPRDMPVHSLGTGLMAYHSSTFSADWYDMQPGLVDYQIAVRAQEQKTPMMLLAHPAGWIKDRPELSLSTNCLRRNIDEKQKAWQVIRNYPWRLWA